MNSFSIIEKKNSRLDVIVCVFVISPDEVTEPALILKTYVLYSLFIFFLISDSTCELYDTNFKFTKIRKLLVKNI